MGILPRRTGRNLRILFPLAGLVVACCTNLADILKTEPQRSTTFTGSHVKMAECVQAELHGGKTQVSLDRSRIDIYDSKKAWQHQGVTYYAVTVYSSGKVELRKLPPGELTNYAAKRLWDPIEYCAKREAPPAER